MTGSPGFSKEDLIKEGAFDLRSHYEKKHGCNLSMDGRCLTHTAPCIHARKLAAIWGAADGS